MKKVLLSVLVLGFVLVGCGKDNKTNSNGLVTTVSNPYSHINTQPQFQSLAQAIANDSFGQYYKQGGVYYPSMEYTYTKFNYACVVKDGWFGIDYNKCSTNGSGTRTALNGQIDVNAKRSELNSILNAAYSFNQGYNGEYYVTTTDGRQVVIDTRYPLQANPVYTYSSSTKTGEQLTNIR